MTNILYALVGITCAIVIEILLNRSMLIKHGGKSFERLLVVSFIYCIIDAFWGFALSHTLTWGAGAVSVVSYLSMGMTTITAFAWILYVEDFIGRAQARLGFMLGLVPLTAQIVLLVVNVSHGMIFTIGEDAAYAYGPYRVIMFALQYTYFVYAVVRAFLEYRHEADEYRKSCCKSVLVFSLIPLATGVLQLLFPFVPFYSIGFMLGATVIFTYNVSTEHTHLLALENQMTKLASRENHNTINAIAGIYMTMHRVDLANNLIRELRAGNSEELPKVNNEAQAYLNDMMSGMTDESLRAAVLDFVCLDTLPRRMAAQDMVAQEFLSVHEGWCRANFIRMTDDENGRPQKVIFAIQRIDEQKKRELEYQRALEKALENQNEVYAEMLQMQSNGIIATDLNNKLLKMNDAAAKMFGYPSSDSFTGEVKDLVDMCEADNKRSILDQLLVIRTVGGRYGYEFSICPDGLNNIYLMAISCRATMTSGEQIMITSLTNITRNKMLERELTQLSQTDALTGIRNRGSGERRISELLKEGTAGMFALMDVDKFKTINDTYGHGVGDKVLVAMAKCLKKSFRGADIVMRLGGDEFAVYAVGITKQETAGMCINRLFDEVDRIDISELNADGRRVSISLGAVLCAPNDSRGFDEIYQLADSRLYESKKEEGNFYNLDRT